MLFTTTLTTSRKALWFHIVTSINFAAGDGGLSSTDVSDANTLEMGVVVRGVAASTETVTIEMIGDASDPKTVDFTVAGALTPVSLYLSLYRNDKNHHKKQCKSFKNCWLHSCRCYNSGKLNDHKRRYNSSKNCWFHSHWCYILHQRLWNHARKKSR